MNLYFLVEGKTERRLYPKWFNILLPHHERINDPQAASHNDYFLISGGGYPGLLDVKLRNSVADVAANGRYDYLIVVLDADDVPIDEREQEVVTKAEPLLSPLRFCRLKVIVQQKCVESWLLGNRHVFHHQPQNEYLRRWVQFYDVSLDDPELMFKPDDYQASVGDFHHVYLKQMLRERNVNYSKKRPGETTKPYYLRALQERVTNAPHHLQTFQQLVQFCERVNGAVTS